jgi:transposase
MRYELSDYEWAAIKPLLPNKPRGVARVDERRLLNSINAAIARTRESK